MPKPRWLALVAAIGFAVAGPAAAASATAGSAPSAPNRFPIVTPPLAAGAQRLHFEVGPLTVKPGQNSISFSRRIPQPSENGWIVGMSTNLHRADGTVPPVNVIHLHHGVWINLASHDGTSGGPERFFAAGEEKTLLALPTGYGYPYQSTDRWLLNYMLHNNLSDPDQIWITYDIDFIPATAPAAQAMKTARPIWMDVRNPSGYPVFDAVKGTGKNGTFTYPDDAQDPYGSGPPRNQWTVDSDGVLLATAGHVHPGGLHDDLYLTRPGATAPAGHAKPGTPNTAHLFTSVADYFEPAGNVSWDFAVTATPAAWRPAVHKGDTLSITTTYDSKHASWYESMGIMVVWMSDDTTGGVNPFQHPVDSTGALTHGHLAENNNHGGKPAANQFKDLRTVKSQVVTSGTVLPIVDFSYPGSMSGTDSVPAISQGDTLTFRNDDASKDIFHTVTACAAPCNLSTGIAYPIANAKIQFDSGELGVGGPPSVGVTSWQVPKNLPPGTYTYFCRIHPFMRGAFRVLPKKT